MPLTSMVAGAAALVLGHGNVTPKSFPTNNLPAIGTTRKAIDPFVGDVNAIEIGAKG